MDSNRFDVMVRRLVGTGSRRSALHALAAGTLGLLAGGPAVAAAENRRNDGKGGNGNGRGDGDGHGTPTAAEADMGANPGAVAGGDGDGPAGATARGSKKGKRGPTGPRGPAGVIGQTSLKTGAPREIQPSTLEAGVSVACDGGTRLLSCGFACGNFGKVVPVGIFPDPETNSCTIAFRNDSTAQAASCRVHALCAG